MKDFQVSSNNLTERRIGAVVTARDEAGDEYRARVVALEGVTATVHPFERLLVPSESRLSLTLIQAIPKKEKMEWIIQKATELGVSRIAPCTSEKSVTLEERDHGQAKSHRWQEIARKASVQSRRRKVPLVDPCTTFLEALKDHGRNGSVGLILYEKERNKGLKDLAWKGVENVVMVCGPDGGFSEEEIATACRFNYTPVRIGGRILRCETAAIAALSIVQFISENL